MTVGQDIKNGIYAMLGARQGCYMTNCTDWDFTNVRDFKYLNELWKSEVEALTSTQVLKILEDLGNNLSRKLRIPVPEILTSSQSEFFKPFLHTWSLSVEEQYYILFPIVLLITFKYFRRYLIHILILGFIVSLGLADWGSINHPSFNFYVLPTRGWELLAGSILAYFEITLGHRSKNQRLNFILPCIGLFLIGYSILFFNDKMFHPSFYTLSPIVGVCLIIWFSDKDELITKILSTKLFVGIGLISYSLYLWHYPIFVFAAKLDIADGNIFIKLSKCNFN
jgi:peptidoglycan/LPS O-acetylase OafA/YrhL